MKTNQQTMGPNARGNDRRRRYGKDRQFRRAADESYPWAMLPASELKLAASATAGKFSSADRLSRGTTPGASGQRAK